MMSTGTPAAGLPDGSSTRPVTVIRPAVAGPGFVAGRGRSTACGTASAAGAAGFCVGSSFIASAACGAQPAPVATDATRKSEIAVGLILESSMSRRTSRASAAGGLPRGHRQRRDRPRTGLRPASWNCTEEEQQTPTGPGPRRMMPSVAPGSTTPRRIKPDLQLLPVLGPAGCAACPPDNATARARLIERQSLEISTARPLSAKMRGKRSISQCNRLRLLVLLPACLYVR